MKNFGNSIRAAFSLMLLLTLLLGFVYPVVVMAFGQMLFPSRAGGSLIERGGKVLGSSLLGQEFTSAKYFWGRPSATDPAYNPSGSTGTNFSPANPKLLEAVNIRIAALQKADPGNKTLVPVDLVTASASGLDPHISLAAAHYQVARVARVRGMTVGAVEAVVKHCTEVPVTGLGKPYVNVLKLNLALDEK